MEMNIITGGTSGLGFAIAKALVEAGQSVLIIGRNKEKMACAVADLRSMNPKVTTLGFAFDISSEHAVKGFYDDILGQYTIKSLFNTAGLGYFGPAQEVAPIHITAMLDANLKGMMLMTTYVLAHMQLSGGKIINIVSTAGLKGKAMETVYCATKWGARGYTEALKAEMKGSKVLVYGVYPGGMATEFWKDSGLASDNFMNPDHVAQAIVDNTFNNALYISDLVIERH